MDPFLKRAFLKHIDEQVTFFELALEDMLNGHEAQAAGDPLGEDRIWYGVQNAILAAANVSKILWGQGGRLAAQRAELRTLLGIEDDSPLKKTTTDFRNHFEHIDERIDEWFASGSPLRSDRTIAGVPPYRADKGQFRWLEAESLIVSFQGHRWDFNEVSVDLLRIRDVLDDYPMDGWIPQ